MQAAVNHVADAALVPRTPGTAVEHAHGRTKCACDEQSLGAVPWLLGAAVMLLGVNWLNARRRAKRQLRKAEGSR